MITHRSSISELYEAAGYRFNFEFRFNAEITDLRVVFPETTLKYRPFIAKCHILSSSYQEMNCRVIKVKQKDLMRGCDRMIASISEEDVVKYSEPRFPGDTKRELTLKIFLTMQ
eukprot:TRINITY_DN283_c0_g1_i7.p1 TRINITY_DN283_c0_g1~~TRINITY_DN283_c0_g1_i7.p1  ORF type:complete len:114 (+),score=14.60 TRINITY_DN283_c0_g1_i7:334-675(+)